MDQVAEGLHGSETADQEVVDLAVTAAIAKGRESRGLTMVGGDKPTARTLKTYKAIAGTAPAAATRESAFSKTDARDVAGKSEMSAVTFEVGLGAALYHLVMPGQTARKCSVHDELGELVSKANGGAKVRRCCCLPTPPLHYPLKFYYP